MRFACWVGKATLARSQALTRVRIQKYVIIFAFPRQQWFREHASVLRYTYVHCLFCSLSLVHKDLPSLAVVFLLRITAWIIITSVVLLDVQVLFELENFDDHFSVQLISTYCCKIRNFLGLCGWACSAGRWGGLGVSCNSYRQTRYSEGGITVNCLRVTFVSGVTVHNPLQDSHSGVLLLL